VPVTVCTDLLRPGGYGRMPQYLINLERRMKEVGARTIDEYIMSTNKGKTEPDIPARLDGTLTAGGRNVKSAIYGRTSALLETSIENSRYHANNNQKPPRKIGSHLHLWDCINCDKCIPVCPNDANFYFEIEPVEIHYKNVKIENGSWSEIDGGIFTIRESHQIATFADACNECGNCDVFCPEDGGPYIEKPRFFGSLDAWRKWNSLSGFFLTRENGSVVLYGRFTDKEYVVKFNEQSRAASFHTDGVEVVLDWDSHRILNVTYSHDSDGKVIDMAYYFTMATLMKGMLDLSRVHFVNVGLLE